MSCYAGPGVGAPDLLGLSPSLHAASLEGLVVRAWGVQEQLEQKPLPLHKAVWGNFANSHSMQAWQS